jgi:hypothetical protein
MGGTSPKCRSRGAICCARGGRAPPDDQTANSKVPVKNCPARRRPLRTRFYLLFPLAREWNIRQSGSFALSRWSNSLRVLCVLRVRLCSGREFSDLSVRICAPLWPLVSAFLPRLHWMRLILPDATLFHPLDVADFSSYSMRP